jgi:hypothetical protein
MTASPTKSNSHLVSAIKWSLSARGNQLRLTGGGRKGFSSTSVLFDFGAIAVKIPANQTVVSGDDGGLGCLTETGRKWGKMLWCNGKGIFW